MKERSRFVVEQESGRYAMAELCRIFGISRETGYKWVERYEAGGPPGRRPGTNDRNRRLPRMFKEHAKGGSMSLSGARRTRREFLRTTAAVVAAPYVLTSTALGAAGRPPASERIGVGCIGVGDMGGGHVGVAGRTRDVQLIAVCDVRKDRCDQLAKQHRCAAYNDFRDLLARDDIDAVMVATPDHWHALITVEAAKAGKDIFSQKPFAYSVAEGRAMVEAVRRYNRVFQHGTQQRSGRRYRHACELVLNGRLGKVHTLRVGDPVGLSGGSTQPAPVPEGFDYDQWLGPAPWAPFTKDRCFGGIGGAGGLCWYHIQDYCAGWITAWGSHDVDIAQWGNGTDHTGPVEIEGRGEFARDGLYDTAQTWHVECRYANGVRLIYTTANEQPHGNRFEGTEGWVFVNRGKIEADPPSLLKEKFGPDEIRLYESNDHFGNFFECVRTRRETVAPPEAGHRSTTICHLAHLAVKLGRPLKWDPEKEKILGDDEANRWLDRPKREPWRI